MFEKIYEHNIHDLQEQLTNANIHIVELNLIKTAAKKVIDLQDVINEESQYNAKLMIDLDDAIAELKRVTLRP